MRPSCGGEQTVHTDGIDRIGRGMHEEFPATITGPISRVKRFIHHFRGQRWAASLDIGVEPGEIRRVSPARFERIELAPSALPEAPPGRPAVPRHNRIGHGEDQEGCRYEISYQPDCLRHVKVQRQLPSGRRSTMTLFRNPQGCAEARPGSRVCTRIRSPEQGIDLEVVVRCGKDSVASVTVDCIVPDPSGNGEGEEISFVVDHGLPRPFDSRLDATS